MTAMHSSPHSTLGFLIHDVARLLRKRFEQHARALGLTRAQYQALAYLAKNEGIHQAGLADLLDIEPITLGRILDKLVARGLVERRQHARDRRVWLLHLTPQAHPILAQVWTLGDLTRSEALDGLAEADRNRLFATLTTMKSNLLAACATPVDGGERKHG